MAPEAFPEFPVTFQLDEMPLLDPILSRSPKESDKINVLECM
jgi:hypothetical protein